MAGAVLVACGDGAGPSAEIPPELTGSWEAAPGCLPNCGFTLIRVDNPADSINFVAGTGTTFLLTLTAGGGFDLNEVLGGIDIRGRARAEGAMLILRDDAGVQDTADYALSGLFLSLAFRGITEAFDFDGDASGDPAVVRATFRRR
ncbi:MAG: hypothetical protein ACRELT_13845 [Longimicrobiales bacterium]